MFLRLIPKNKRTINANIKEADTINQNQTLTDIKLISTKVAKIRQNEAFKIGTTKKPTF